MAVLRAIEAEQRAQRKKVFEDYETRMKPEREKLDRAKAAYQKAEGEFRAAQELAGAAQREALEDINLWGAESKRAAEGVTRPRTLSDVVKTIRKTRLHGAKVSVARLTCLEAADAGTSGGA